MSRALITGGAGFIGSHLARRLAQEGLDVVIVDDLSWGLRSRLDDLKQLTFIEGSVESLSQLVPDVSGITHVFHLAALISAYESLEKPEQYLRTNVLGLLQVVDLCRRMPNPRLIFASTSGIYGNSETPTKHETDLPCPTTVYAATKLTGEHLLAMYRARAEFDDVALRFFNVYGPGQSPKHPYANVTCRFSRAAALGEAVELIGDGKQTRDFIYVSDVVDAMMTVAFNPVKERLYNVGTGQDASIAELLESVQQLAKTKLRVQQRPPWPNDIRHIRADISRIARDFGYAPRVSLSAGLTQTIDFFRSVGETF